MDFGIAYLVNQDALTMTGAFMGSPNFISPEQAEGGTISGKSDVFSVGSVMYQCATAKVPFAGESVHATIYSVIHDAPDPAFRQNSKLLSDISDTIHECLIKEAKERPSVHDVVTRIEEISAGMGLAVNNGQEFSRQNPEVREGGYPVWPEYREYYHNYPHIIPPDYVFRTGRVFGPSPGSFNWRAPLAFFRGDGKSSRGSQSISEDGEGSEGGLPLHVAELAARLMASGQEYFTDEYVLTVSTFVNLNDLYVTSALGRYLAEQIMAELQSRGASVVEIRKTPAIMIRQKEEDMLD